MLNRRKWERDRWKMVKRKEMDLVVIHQRRDPIQQVFAAHYKGIVPNE